jgi:hypothetical protein
MRKTLFFTSLTGLALAVIAQAAGPVLQIADLAPVGARCQMHQVTITSPSRVDPGSAGADQTWDFSNLQSTPTDTAENIDRSSVPHDIAAALPNANSWEKLYNGTSVSYNAYHQYSASVDVIAMGARGDAVSGITYTQLYTIPETFIIFPFSYGDSFLDTCQALGFTFPYTQRYDAYGTLITPFGTYTNVVRTRFDAPGGNVFYRWWATNPIWPIMDNFDSTSVAISTLIPSTIVHQRTINPAGRHLSVTSAASEFDILGRFHSTAFPGKPRSSMAAKRFSGILVGSAANGQVKLISPFGEGR